jgi:hypothetical protein
MQYLHSGVECVFELHIVYCTVTVMQASAPMGAWAWFTGLTHTL